MWSVAKRPRWIAALVLALALAAGFAALGRWQLGRAVEQAVVVKYPTETVLPLTRFAQPQKPTTDRAAGQMMTVTGRRVAGDTYVISDRPNFGKTGWWVVGHVVTTQDVGLVVALGWTPTKAKAEAAAADLESGAPSQAWVGRYQPTEPPDQQNFEQGQQSVVSVPQLLNQWTTQTPGVYDGYLVLRTPAAGLERIQSPKPADSVTPDWLNIFYAVEWALFAGFAVYLWYRLVRDTWEREIEAEEHPEIRVGPSPAVGTKDSADPERENVH